MSHPDRRTARRIIETVGSHGTPPEWGFQYFTVGLDPYIGVIDGEYLKTYVKEDAGAAFKVVIGAYGGGKTHFLYCIRDLAWRENFLVSYVPLSPDETPFHKLEYVYRSIVRNVMYPQRAEALFEGSERGIEAFLKTWYHERKQGIDRETTGDVDSAEAFDLCTDSVVSELENTNFANAFRSALRALWKERNEDFRNIMQWVKMEGYSRDIHREHGILHGIDRSNAFSMIRSLVQLIKNAGFSGLVILFDEAEQIPSLSSRQRDQMLANLRELIDACGNSTFRNVMIFYAIPDENFFEGRSNVYEALKQRIATVFDFFNPTGVKIRLEKLEVDSIDFLTRVGEKLADVYVRGYEQAGFTPEELVGEIRQVAEAAYEQRFGDLGYKRVFVQAVVRLFHLKRTAPGTPLDEHVLSRLVSGAEE